MQQVTETANENDELTDEETSYEDMDEEENPSTVSEDDGSTGAPANDGGELSLFD